MCRPWRFGPHGLHGRHHIGLLIGERLPEARCPREVMGQVIEHRRKLRERLHAGIPGLLIHGLRQRLAGQVLFCASQSSAYATWSGFVEAASTCATNASG